MKKAEKVKMDVMTRTTRSTVVGGLLIGLATVVAVLVTTPGTTASAQIPSLDSLMQQKLDHSQGLLEAMVLADFEGVERFANGLIQVSEVSDWSSSQEPEYLNYASDFRDTATVLIEEAQAANVDGIAISYMEMTLTCVRCHRFLSRTRQAR